MPLPTRTLTSTPAEHLADHNALHAAHTGSALLAVTSYNPGSQASYATTSSTSIDADATNLVVAFTVPSTGRVLVRLIALGNGTGAGNMYWQVREDANVVSTDQMMTGSTASNRLAADFHITGLTPGASKTYKWGYKRDGSTTATFYAGGNIGPAMLEVWTAP